MPLSSREENLQTTLAIIKLEILGELIAIAKLSLILFISLITRFINMNARAAPFGSRERTYLVFC